MRPAPRDDGTPGGGERDPERDRPPPPAPPLGGGDRPRGLVAEEKSDYEELVVSAICLGSPGEPRDQQSLANLCHCHSTILM